MTGSTDNLGRQIDYQYNKDGQLTGETWYSATGVLNQTLTFTYDHDGNQTGAANGNGTYTLSNNGLNQVSDRTGAVRGVVDVQLRCPGQPHGSAGLEERHDHVGVR